MIADAELRDRLRRYYEAYYRGTLGLRDWQTLVTLREDEEAHERRRFDRLRLIVDDPRARGRVLNVGCGTGGFNVVAAESGARAVGVDDDDAAIAICELKRRKAGGEFVRAASERLPFCDGTFDLVYCFSTIEHVRSVGETVREMVRVARPGGAIYVHTPNAWSFYEGHYKVFWLPVFPRMLARAYLRSRGRPTAYLATLRRLTSGQLRRAFAATGVTSLTFFDDERPRESKGPLAPALTLYYRLTGIAPFIELVAWKP